jgi:hypothetical protein
MTLHQCGQCGTPHDSMAEALECCAEQFDDDHDSDGDRGAAPVAVADGGYEPLDEPQTVPWRSGDRVYHTHRCPNYESASRTRALRPGEREDFRQCKFCVGDREDYQTPDEPTAHTLENLDPSDLEKMDADDLRADGGRAHGHGHCSVCGDWLDDIERATAPIDKCWGHKETPIPDGGRVTAGQDHLDARTVTIRYLRDRLESGESSIVLARHVSAAAEVSSHRAGRVLARLAGQTDGIGEPEADAPADLQVECAWEGSSAKRWRVLRDGRATPESEPEAER